MKKSVVLIGVGEIGNVFARGILKTGYPVYPITRGMSIADVAADVPDPESVIVAVGEKDIKSVLESIPQPWQDRLCRAMSAIGGIVLQNSVASPAAQHLNPYVDLDESLLRESTRLRINIAPRTFKNSFATVSPLSRHWGCGLPLWRGNSFTGGGIWLRLEPHRRLYAKCRLERVPYVISKLQNWLTKGG